MAGLYRIIILILFVSCAPIGIAQQARSQIPEGNAAYQRGDYSTAFEIFREQATEGQAGAQYNLGIMYLEGRGVERDYGQAARWIRQAAEGGLAAAQFQLGTMHAQGRGVERDYERAEEWWRRAADQGHVESQHALGVNYAIGRGPGWGLDRDDAEAARWWQMAAQAGHGPAQYELGLAYLDGRGVERDPETGLMWLLLAEKSGDAGERYEPDRVERWKRRLSGPRLSAALKRAETCRETDYTDCD